MRLGAVSHPPHFHPPRTPPFTAAFYMRHSIYTVEPYKTNLTSLGGPDLAGYVI